MIANSCGGCPIRSHSSRARREDRADFGRGVTARRDVGGAQRG